MMSSGAVSAAIAGAEDCKREEMMTDAKNTQIPPMR